MKAKERIVKEAIKLFNNLGVHSTTTNHIANELNMSPGNLYYHYRNKEEIIRDIYVEMIHYMDTAWISTNNENYIEEVISYLRRTMQLQYRYRFFYKEIGVLLVKDEELKKLYTSNRKKRLEQMRQYYEDLDKKGYLNLPKDDDQCKLLIETIWYLSEWWLQHGMILPRMSIQKLIERNMNMLFILIKPYVPVQYWDLLNNETN